jgi:hypothetical protein
MSSKKETSGIFSYLHNIIQNVNGSKIFAGLIVVTLNIASKFVTIKLSKSMESYLKHTFSRDVLIFCIVWMGSREIYIAFFITLIFIFFMDFLFNEDSWFCILPENFKNHHIGLLENMEPSSEEILQAEKILKRVKPKDPNGSIPSDMNTSVVASENVSDTSVSIDTGFMPIKW